MSMSRPHEVTADLAVQPTVSALHIPASHAFIPFQQFSISDTALRNPADDNNNKPGGGSLPVVSVVTAVSGLHPALPVVSMQQQQLPQAVVAQTILPTVVAPMGVQANGVIPTSAITMTNNINISSHLSLHTQQQHIANNGLNLSAHGVAHNSHLPQPNIATSTSAVNGHAQVIAASAGSANMNATNSSGHAGNSVTSSNSNTVNNSSNNNTPKVSNPTQTGVKPSPPGGQNMSGSEQNDDLVKPVFKDGEFVLEVECGQNKGILYLSKLCQGSKGPCISFQSSWLTPNEFQFVSGRETAKDWKRSIRHHGKSLKLLLAKGILAVHPTMCDCDGCRQGATLVSCLACACVSDMVWTDVLLLVTRIYKRLIHLYFCVMLFLCGRNCSQKRVFARTYIVSMAVCNGR